MESYRVVLSGNVVSGFNVAGTRPQLAQLMRRDEVFAGRLLAGKPTTVKSGVDAATAQRYVKALLAVGAECQAEPEALDFDVHAGPMGTGPVTQSAAEALPAQGGPSGGLPALATDKPAADYGLFLLIVPVAACVLAWFWIGSMNLLEGPGSKLDGLMVVAILATAVIAATEASKVGMVSDRAKGTYSPIAWFFLIALLWIVGYPAYLLKRRHYGLRNQLVAGLAIALVFVGTYYALGSTINAKVDEVQGAVHEFQSQAQKLQDQAQKLGQ